MHPTPAFRLPTLATSTLVLIVAFLAFVSIGFPDAVLGVAWPSIRTTFDLPQTGFGSIVFFSAAGYSTSGAISGTIIERLSLGNLLVVSTACVTTGLLGYALAPVFAVFLALAVLVGLGSGAIDAALNVYAAEHFTEAAMNWLHAFFGLGALVGPLLMGAVLDHDLAWRWGYIIVGGILLMMTITFVLTHNLWGTRSRPHHHDAAPVIAAPFRRVLGTPLIWLNVAIFFFSTGVEYTGGQWAFTVMRERFGQPESIASLWAGLYWGALVAGRLTLGMISARVGTARMVQIGIAGNIIGGVIYALGSYEFAVVGLLLMGYWMAPLFPLLMILTPRRLGSAIAVHAVGFQVSSAVFSGAIFLWIAGYLSSRTSLAAIGWVAVVGGIVLFVLHGLMMRFDNERVMTVTHKV